VEAIADTRAEQEKDAKVAAGNGIADRSGIRHSFK